MSLRTGNATRDRILNARDEFRNNLPPEQHDTQVQSQSQAQPQVQPQSQPQAQPTNAQQQPLVSQAPVSYTHLTLPTICSV